MCIGYLANDALNKKEEAGLSNGQLIKKKQQYTIQYTKQ